MIVWNLVLGYSGRSVQGKIGKARFVHESMTGNTYFPDPSPSLDELLKTTNELENLFTISRDGSKEDIRLMYAKERELHILMKRLGNYVENIALVQNDEGAAIITSAGFDVKSFAGGSKRMFTVVNTGVAGKVELTAFSEGRNAAYNWYYSTDGENFTLAKTTNKGEHTITGLEPAVRYWFTMQAIVDDVDQPIQGPVILVVT